MKKVKPRKPEGGAIEDNSQMTMEQYSKTMKKKLGSAYVQFANDVICTINPVQNSNVLEIGPGPGWAGINLLKKRPDLKLEGLEASTDMIRVASDNAQKEELGNRITYREGMAEEMIGISDAQYDVVISRDSLHHWMDPKKVFLQIKRVLKENGKIYIHDHKRNLNLFGRFILSVLGPLMAGRMAKYWKSSVAAAYTREEIIEMLQSNGFNDWVVDTSLMDLIIYRK